jgi:hypothetical protein
LGFAKQQNRLAKTHLYGQPYQNQLSMAVNFYMAVEPIVTQVYGWNPIIIAVILKLKPGYY